MCLQGSKLIEDQLSIHVQDNQAIISASWRGSADLRVISTFCRYYREHLSVVKLLIELGADIHVENNKAPFIGNEVINRFMC